MTVLVAVQARTGSTRLPGKVLEPLDGRPMLQFQIERLRAGLPDAWDLTIATTTSPGDDAVVELADSVGLSVFRGSEHDVLARYATLLDQRSASVLVRLTGDCPLTDPEVVRDAVALHEQSGAAYTSNVYPRSFPKGLDVEVTDRDALLAAAAEAVDPVEREHVTPFIVRRPERFAMATLFSGSDLGDERWTVDLPEDIDRVRSIVQQLDHPISDGWREILRIVGPTPIDPAAIRFRPLDPPAPASTPWIRSWSIERAESRLGTAQVAVGDGSTSSTVDAPADQEAAEAAFESFMAGDVQLTR